MSIRTFVHKTLILSLSIAAGANLAASAYAAGERPGTGARASAHQGHGHTRTTQVQRTGSGHVSHSTRTDAHGRTATRDATVVNDRAAGTRSRDVTYTGRDGSVRSVDDDVTRTESGYARTTVTTGRSGGITTRESEVVRDVDTHSAVKTVTVTHTPAP